MKLPPTVLAGLSMIVLTVLCSGGLAVLPERGLRWFVPVLFLSGLWLFLEVFQDGTPDFEGRRRSIMNWHRHVVAWTALLVSLGIASKLAVHMELLGLEGEAIASRVFGMMFGLGLATWGNLLPKVESPWTLEDEPFDWNRVHLFAGRIMFLCGITLTITWAVLPPADAGAIAEVLIGSAVLLAIGCKFHSLATHAAHPQP